MYFIFQMSVDLWYIYELVTSNLCHQGRLKSVNCCHFFVLGFALIGVDIFLTRSTFHSSIIRVSLLVTFSFFNRLIFVRGDVSQWLALRARVNCQHALICFQLISVVTHVVLRQNLFSAFITMMMVADIVCEIQNLFTTQIQSQSWLNHFKHVQRV